MCLYLIFAMFEKDENLCSKLKSCTRMKDSPTSLVLLIGKRVETKLQACFVTHVLVEKEGCSLLLEVPKGFF